MQATGGHLNVVAVALANWEECAHRLELALANDSAYDAESFRLAQA